MGGNGQDQVAALLEDPAAYGCGVRRVDRVETHAAIVFLAGERAYKLKRAVTFAYLDYATPALRRRACEAELAINRRTAPNLYLGTAPVLDAGGRLRLGAIGDWAGRPDPGAVDWVVVMRRFDEDALLARMAERGALDGNAGLALAEDLAIEIARFHGTAQVRRDHGGAAGIRRVIAIDAAGIEGRQAVFPAPEARALTAAASRALSSHGALLDRRAGAGWVRHVHGDLHLGNIFVQDGRPVLFDAIEFDEGIACIDVLFDLAFLLMDLEHRGLRAAACRALSTYVGWIDGAGAMEATVEGLAALPLLLSCRAAIRANVTAEAAARQGRPPDQEARARAYLARAQAYLAEGEAARPRLIAVGGKSGTGKSTLAHALAPHLHPAPGALVLRSDVIRKRLWGAAPTDVLPPEAYGETMTLRTFATLAALAESALKAGRSVICDAVFAHAEQRTSVEAAASAAGARFDGVWLEAPDAARIARVIDRAAGARRDASDAGAEIAQMQTGWSDAGVLWQRIAAGGGIDEVLQGAIEVASVDAIASELVSAAPSGDRNWRHG